MEKNFKRTTVTSVLPYAKRSGPYRPSGRGLCAGRYLRAHLRLKRRRALYRRFDEHGVPITIRAKKEGVTPQDIVDRYHTLIKDSLKNSVFHSMYGRTSSPTHHQLASDFFRKLAQA